MIIRHFQLENRPVSNLKLQKLLYYIQAWHMVYFDKHTFFKEQPEAWVNGPVYRDIYTKYKDYGYMPITPGFEKSLEEDYTVLLERLGISEEQRKFLESLFSYYGKMSAEELAVRTHVERPWNNARAGLGPIDSSDRPITHESMYNYYISTTSQNKG